MKITCSYCLADMGQKDPLADTRHSHSICPPCFAKFSRECEAEDMVEDLADSPIPLAIVDSDVRLLAVNPAMEDVLGDDSDGLRGRRAGEVLGCEQSRGRRGCGHGAGCTACPVRTAVNQAYSGNDQVCVPGFVDQSDGRLDIVLSA